MSQVNHIKPVEHSGAQWVSRFPTSRDLAALAEPFRTHVTKFIGAMRAARITVNVSATYRPAERAYLMHYCTLVADGAIAPNAVPPQPDVPIDWTCGGNHAAAIAGAKAMADGYGIEYPAALVSRHTQRNAVDMSVSWSGQPVIAKPDGSHGKIVSTPCDGGNPDLQHIGALYGVMKLQSDPPHWSIDGH